MASSSSAHLAPSLPSTSALASPGSAANNLDSLGQSGQQSLLGRQVLALRQMLHLQEPQSSSSSSSLASSYAPQWKVLVFDRVGQDILAPVLSVKCLRDEGVTLHLYLMSERDPVPEVPAIYFCQPSEDNLRRIGEDMRAGLYGAYYFNFVSPIQRQRLEDLAGAAIQANAVQQVRKLYDQYVNFVCLENEMFTLKHQSSSSLSYYALNRSGVDDAEMEGMLNQIVDSLFAVCVTLGTIPIIRCPKGNAAEAVAQRLDRKIRENLRDARNTLFVSDGGIQAGGQFSFQRPLLVILDRQFDLATPLHHTWTYQALAHDVLKYSLNRYASCLTFLCVDSLFLQVIVNINRVSITEPAPEGGAGRKPKSRECDLDSADLFWRSHKGLPFPSVS